jgi:hypothetical protein
MELCIDEVNEENTTDHIKEIGYKKRPSVQIAMINSITNNIVSIKDIINIPEVSKNKKYSDMNLPTINKIADNNDKDSNEKIYGNFNIKY